ncbi:pentatricopeptide repeat-containing protein [Quercus suber]|uniref:Pentatricopeptide repeat-containing protein n=1 Tax=Quercus suber TaxID=58331 RepID=A0AAW0K2M0_QUESU
MNYQGCYPNKESYRILMKGLCKDGRMNEAAHLLYSMFWRISQKGSGEDIVVYRTLLCALCDNRQVEKAVEIHGKILRKGLKAPKRCFQHLDLSQCSSGEDIEGTKRLINEALIRGGIPSLASYSAMAIDLYNEGKISEAKKVFIQMKERGFRPTNLIFEAKVAALCRRGNVDAAVKVIEQEMEGNCLPNVMAYNIVLKGLCNERKSVVAVGYLKKMAKKLGCNADKETYSIVVDGLCRESRYLEASQVLQEILIKSYWPCVDTYNILTRGLCSVGRQYESVLWLEEMISQSMKPELSV